MQFALIDLTRAVFVHVVEEVPVSSFFLVVESFWEGQRSSDIACFPVKADPLLCHRVHWSVDIRDVDVKEVLGVLPANLVSVGESPYSFSSRLVVFELALELVSAWHGPGTVQQLAFEPLSG